MPIAEMLIMVDAAHQGNEPWLSLEWASWIFDRASFVLFGSLIFGAVATAAIVWMGIVKEEHWDILRETARVETERAQGAAANATAAAGKAHERAAALEADAEKARAELGKANADIDNAQEAIANAQRQTAILEKEAAVARLEQERLKERLAWRTLTSEQLEKLKESLSSAPSLINIEFVSNDTEAQYLAIQIANVLIDAKWQIGMMQVTYAGTLFFGVTIPDSSGEGTELMRRAFRHANLGFGTAKGPDTGPMGYGARVDTAASIIVGSQSTHRHRPSNQIHASLVPLLG